MRNLPLAALHLQTVKICHGFIALSFQALFELAPISRGIHTFVSVPIPCCMNVNGLKHLHFHGAVMWHQHSLYSTAF